MKSVKPGRAPSFMSGVGTIIVGVFGVFWTIFARSIGAPGIFTAFGVLFVVLALVMAVYNFANATGKNRFSEFDITDSREEPDPLNQRFGGATPGEAAQFHPDDETEFCPFCGALIGDGYRYCRKCGKKLPE